MRILFVSNINGNLDEGMRNVSTHVARELAKRHDVREMGLREAVTAKLPQGIDAVIVGARARKRSALICARLRHRYKGVPILLLAVQPVSKEFADAERFLRLGVEYAFFSKEDVDDFSRMRPGKYELLKVGMDQSKFHAPSSDQRIALRIGQYLHEGDKKLLHVGHCSEGRGLDVLAELDQRYKREVVCSGLFNDDAVVAQLKDTGVVITTGYIPGIESKYQASDVYVFPTTDRDFVISTPLSVLEALACGVPVVACRGISSLTEIEVADERYLQVVDRDDVGTAVAAAAKLPNYGSSLVPGWPTWEAVTAMVERILEERGARKR